MLRDLVLPRVLEYFVNILEWIKSGFLNVQVFFRDAKFGKYCCDSNRYCNTNSNDFCVV